MTAFSSQDNRCPECGELIEDGGCECYPEDEALDEEEEPVDFDIIQDDDEDIKSEDSEVA